MKWPLDGYEWSQEESANLEDPATSEEPSRSLDDQSRDVPEKRKKINEIKMEWTKIEEHESSYETPNKREVNSHPD